jgi:cytochrome c-type biogenesis protein CcmH
MKLRLLLLVAILLSSFFCLQSSALAPEQRLENDKDEKRAFNLFTEVKCLVCEAQTIDSSSSEFAYQLRQLIRQKILDHKSDEQIKTELIDEFGEDVITSSGLNQRNYLLWILPALFAMIAVIVIARTKR